MLRAMEDLLDTWPGTLIVVSHDRYLLERVTDQQYAIVDGEFRHMPGGVDQYLREQKPASGAVLEDVTRHSSESATPTRETGLRAGSKERRIAEKEHAAIARKIDALDSQIAELDQILATIPPDDYEALGATSTRRQEFEASRASLETRWLELADALGI
jgi:ATPase subunit of ABC transporter with duplicated ATPase domains